MEEFAYALKNFTWEGELRIDDIVLTQNRILCRLGDFEEAEISVNLFLDLIALMREKDVYFESAHHTYVEQANRLRTYTTAAVPERMVHLSVLRDFLLVAYPKYRDERFREKTGIQWALRFYLAALGVEFLQARFLCFFSALEILLAHINLPAVEGPLTGLIQAVKKIPSIPSGTRDIAAERLTAPSMAEHMVEFVRQTKLEGVAFQSGGSDEARYRFDELLRIREEFRRQGHSTRLIHGEGGYSLHLFLGQLRDLVRDSLMIVLNQK